MFKNNITLILVILIFIISISGCTTKTATNGTFGEKSISINSIYLANNATSNIYNSSNNGQQYYFVHGYLVNNNSNDVFHVKVNSTAYDVNGNVVATNNSAYLQYTSISAKGTSEIYVEFPDNNNNIVRYDIKIVSASGTI